MEYEISYIHIDANDPELEMVSRLWNVLIFRPDIASFVEEACRGGDILLIPFADLLREAIDAADFPKGIW